MISISDLSMHLIAYDKSKTEHFTLKSSESMRLIRFLLRSRVLSNDRCDRMCLGIAGISLSARLKYCVRPRPAKTSPSTTLQIEIYLIHGFTAFSKQDTQWSRANSVSTRILSKNCLKRHQNNISYISLLQRRLSLM